MEKEGAKEIFLRSIDKYKLKYTTFVGDGDSGCFGWDNIPVNNIAVTWVDDRNVPSIKNYYS